MISNSDRAVLYELQRSINTARSARLGRVRSYKNALRGTVVLLTLTAVAIPLVVPIIATDIGILRPLPQGGTTPAALSRGDLLTIEVWGVVGGLVGLVAALRKLVSTNAPSTLQSAQLLLKVPAGAVTAIFGTLVLQSGIISSLTSATLTQLTAYALLFGFSQEVATGLVDQRAGKLLEQSKTTNEAATTPGSA